MIDLGRINTITKVLLLSFYLALPRKAYLDAAVHVMTHVGERYDSRLVYNFSYLEIDCSVIKKCDCPEFYEDAKEAIPMNAPEPQGKKVDICMFVDSDHGGDKIFCKLKSGLLIYVSTTLVQWFSKKQSTVETSAFGTEFVAMKQGIDAPKHFHIMSLIYLWE